MFSGLKQLMEKDSITLIDVYDVIDDISDEVWIMLRTTLIIGFVLGVICMAIVDKIVG